MLFRVENVGMLLGLFALAVPIIVHLLKRRRFDTIDWGAMQFLPDTRTVQRRRWLDEILLMLLRMGMIALIVLALATPTSTSDWLAPLRDRSTRDIVLVLDGSYSMDLRMGNQLTPWEEAVRAAKAHVLQSASGDRFAVVIARQPPVVWQEEFTSDLAKSLDVLPAPSGNPAMPAALAEAWKHVQTRSKASVKEIVVFTDRQRHGWADPETLAALDQLGGWWQTEGQHAATSGDAVPSLRVVNVGSELPARVPNFSLAPLTTSRSIVKVGQSMALQSALRLDGFDKYVKPRKVKVLINGKPTEDLPLPDAAEVRQGQIALTWRQKFDSPGRHLVTLMLDLGAADDALSVDNAQHVVIDVVKEIPVLLIDGDRQIQGESSTFFLQRALATKRALPYSAFKRSSLQGGQNEKPAVIVLADVPRLEPGAVDAIEQFLADGGGVLVALGERVAREKGFYNEQLHRTGQGWLPARLGDIASSTNGERPDPRKFEHPALELFRTAPDGVMSEVRFSKWWRAHPERGTPIAFLANGDRFLIEMPYKKGRVILCTTPLDRRWGSTFPNVAEFPVLINELVMHLAGARQTVGHLQKGESIQIGEGSRPGQLTLRTPEAKSTIDVKSWPWTYANTGSIGVYQATASDGRAWTFAVPPDLRESDLTRCSEADWKKVRDRLPIVWNDEPAAAPSIATPASTREELWWLLLAGVIGLLCTEVWMTRRMALARGR